MCRSEWYYSLGRDRAMGSSHLMPVVVLRYKDRGREAGSTAGLCEAETPMPPPCNAGPGQWGLGANGAQASVPATCRDIYSSLALAYLPFYVTACLPPMQATRTDCDSSTSYLSQWLTIPTIPVPLDSWHYTVTSAAIKVMHGDSKRSVLVTCPDTVGVRCKQKPEICIADLFHAPTHRGARYRGHQNTRRRTKKTATGLSNRQDVALLCGWCDVMRSRCPGLQQQS